MRSKFLSESIVQKSRKNIIKHHQGWHKRQKHGEKDYDNNNNNLFLTHNNTIKVLKCGVQTIKYTKKAKHTKNEK